MKLNNNSRITRITKLKYVNNSMYTGWWYLVYCRLYISDTYYYRCKFIISFEPYDIIEYFDDEDSEPNFKITDEMFRQYRNELAFSVMDMFEQMKDIKEVIEYCNKTIQNYNN